MPLKLYQFLNIAANFVSNFQVIGFSDNILDLDRSETLGVGFGIRKFEPDVGRVNFRDHPDAVLRHPCFVLQI